MTEIFEELSVIGDSIDVGDRVVHFLTSLPDSYDMSVIALEASQYVPKWALVTEQLLYEETKSRAKETGDAESKAMTSKHHINKRGPKCFNCEKNVKHVCRLLGEDSKVSLKRNYQKKKTFFTDEIPADHSRSKNVYLHTMHTNNERSSQTVDSGAKRVTMCHNVNRFINFTRLDVSK